MLNFAMTVGKDANAEGAMMMDTINENLGEPPAMPVLRSCYAEHKAVRRVLPLFVADLPSQVATLNSHVSKGDLAAARRLVHGLRGSGGGYGFPAITNLATVAEAAIDAQESDASIATSIGGLIALLRRVEGYDPSKEHTVA